MEVDTIINQAESFENQFIDARFKKELKNKFNILDDDTANAIKKEALRYLALCAIYPNQDIGMYSKIIDEFWHTFMLFSMEYFAFCKTLGQTYIHHVPNCSAQDNNSECGFSNFAELYKNTFHEDPAQIWYLSYNKTTKTCEQKLHEKRCGKQGCSHGCKGACLKT